jgi:hypothetical protein
MPRASSIALLLLLGCGHAGAEEGRTPGRGCGDTRWQPGQTTAETLDNQGRTRQFQLHVPVGYDPEALTPVVLYFHGWGGQGNLNWLRGTADDATFIAVGPTGVGTGENPDGGLNSWNGGGSTESPGPRGASCAEGSPEYCYDSCAARPQVCCGYSQPQTAAAFHQQTPIPIAISGQRGGGGGTDVSPNSPTVTCPPPPGLPPL